MVEVWPASESKYCSSPGVYISPETDVPELRKIHPSSRLLFRINVGYNEELQACQVQQVGSCFALLELSLILDGEQLQQLQPNKHPSVRDPEISILFGQLQTCLPVVVYMVNKYL